jgi:UDP-glucose:(heptosyl)LPS alpha-1,3-glucosyltransferase
MDIAITVGSFHRAGGIERVSVRLAEAYTRLGHTVTVYAADWDPTLTEHFHLTRVSAPAKPAWLRTLTLGEAISRRLKRHDWVHGQGVAGTRCDLLTYHTVHAAWLDISANLKVQPPWLGLAKRAWPFHRATIAIERNQARTHQGKFHTCSRAVREEAISYYGVAPERIAAIPWGIDLVEFQPDANARAACRRDWELNPDDLTLLIVANEFRRKGLSPLINALAELSRPEVKLLVVGRDTPVPWTRLIERLGLRSQVKFLGSQSAALAYQAADIFVMPTLYEGWSLVIGEALASGLPVITTHSAGSSDLIRPGHNGFLLENPLDVASLVQVLEQLMEPNLRKRIATAARPSVANYSWESVAKTLVSWGT